ncbi:MAG: T9SS type A sorting domain-containing protein [Xanthomarina sp.]
MKKNICLMIICFSFYSLSHAQYTLIPDANFEQRLINLGIDSEGILDGQILTIDANGYSGALSMINKGITNLTGIEAFINTTGLDFSYNTGITYVNLSNCASLLTVDGTGCTNLASVNVTGLANLTKLKFTFASLMSLDLTTNLALKDLNVRGNQITNLDLTHNVVLDHVDVKSNPLIFIDLRNGNCMNMVFYVGDYTPCLKCIYVDNSSDPHLWDHAYWMFDDLSMPVATEAECAALPEIPEEYCPALGIETVSEFTFNMFPNPVNGLLHVRANYNSGVFQICSINGKVILTKNLNARDYLIDVSGLASGIYVAKLVSDRGVDTKKLIVK